MVKKKTTPRVATIANSIQKHNTNVEVQLTAFKRGLKTFKKMRVLDSKGHELLNVDSSKNTIPEIIEEVEKYFGRVWEPDFDPEPNYSRRNKLIERLEKKKRYEKIFDFGFVERTQFEVIFFHLLFDEVEVGMLKKKTEEYTDFWRSYESVLRWVNRK